MQERIIDKVSEADCGECRWREKFSKRTLVRKKTLERKLCRHNPPQHRVRTFAERQKC